jgi:hypothetical protein
MNLQERKLNIIEQLIILDDDSLIKKIEGLIDTTWKRPNLKKFTKQDIKKRAMISEKNIRNKEVYSLDEVKRILKES